jgi:tetratricopeptide (TPR) repeat protein
LNLASCVSATGDHQRALEICDKSHAILDPLVAKSGSSEARKYFLNLLVTRSKFLSYVNRYQEALADIEQGIRLSGNRPNPTLLLMREAYRAGTGLYVEAVGAVRAILAGGPRSRLGPLIYECAVVLAVAARMANDDPDRQPAQRVKSAEEYLGEASELIASAAEVGLLNRQGIRLSLHIDPRLEMLRKRKEIQELLKRFPRPKAAGGLPRSK